MSLAPSGGKSISQASQKAHDSLAELSKGYEATEEPQDRAATARKHNDELERLDIWIAEHEVSKGELDHKLREASHLRGRVISLLQELYGTHAIRASINDHELTNSRNQYKTKRNIFICTTRI